VRTLQVTLFQVLIGILAALSSNACSVGQGQGSAVGELFVLGCSGKGDYCQGDVCGTAINPVPFNLSPSFFAGEPINDIRLGIKGTEILTNRVLLRLQRSGVQLDLNDVLTFDFTNSYEVARCVRGRKFVGAGGVVLPDWDEANCYRASDSGPARVRLHVDGVASSALCPWTTCSAQPVAQASAISANQLGTAQSIPPNGEWESWVELEEFGKASEAEILDPLLRTPVHPQFHISLGERVRALRFKMLLVDQHIITAVQDRLPIPAPVIGGKLEGAFDFELKRGQGAQTFP
jgi:hypothetical protein